MATDHRAPHSENPRLNKGPDDAEDAVALAQGRVGGRGLRADGL